MKSQQVTGLTLIVGAVAMLIGIAAHPHHSPYDSHGDMREQNLLVAIIVLTSFIVTGTGLQRLFRSLPSRLSRDIASIVLALAGISGSLAAITGHVVAPRFIHGAGTADNVEPGTMDLVVAHHLTLGGTLSLTMLVAWAIGVLFLSLSLLQRPVVGSFIPSCGIAIAILFLSLLMTGHFSMTFHSLGLVVLVSGTWLVALGSVFGFRHPSVPLENH